MEFLTSDLISIPHGMLNRNDGSGMEPFSSLNVSYGVGDNPQHVEANRQRVKETLRITSLLTAKQVHGNKVYSTASKVESDTEVDGFDAIITDQTGVGLLIQQADCQAILVHDPANNVIAAIHCGWRGSVANIIKATIVKMQEKYQTVPENLLAAISPSLGPCCAEFINHDNELPKSFHRFQEKPNHFNFWNISAMQLEEAGVLSSHIDVKGICTCCNPDYFSYRRSTKKGQIATGRNCSLISLPRN